MIDLSNEPIMMERKDVLRVTNLTVEALNRLMKDKVFPKEIRRKNRNAKMYWHRGEIESFLNHGYQEQETSTDDLIKLIDQRLVEILRNPANAVSGRR